MNHFRIFLNLFGRKGLILTYLVLISFYANAQIISPVKWSYSSKKINKGEAIIYIKATIMDEWHIYSVYQKSGGPERTSFNFDISKSYTLAGKIVEPKALKKREEVFDMDVFYFEHTVLFTQKVRIKANQVTIRGKVEFMACNAKQCLPLDEVSFSIPIK